MTPEQFQKRLTNGEQPDQEHEVEAVKKLARCNHACHVRPQNWAWNIEGCI